MLDISGPSSTETSYEPPVTEQPTPVKVQVRRLIEKKSNVTNEVASSQNDCINPKTIGPVRCPYCKICFTPTKEEKQRLKQKDFVDDVTKDDQSCFRYTGFPNIKLLNGTYDWIEPVLQNVKLWGEKSKHTPGKTKQRKRTAMSLFEEYILTLVCIRRGYDTPHLAYLFGVAQSHISRIVITWVNVMYRCFMPLLRWPSKDLVSGNLPASFKTFLKTRVIIDATDFHIEEPFHPVALKTT